MALRLDMSVLYDNGTIPAVAKGFVESLNLPSLARADASILHCLKSLATWIGEGEVNSLIAFLMLAVCVVGFTALDILALNVIAAGLPGSNDAEASREPSSSTLAVTRILKKLSMLDVLIVGVVVVVLSGSIYKKQGLVLNLRWGLLMLFGAEVCHHVLY